MLVASARRLSSRAFAGARAHARCLSAHQQQRAASSSSSSSLAVQGDADALRVGVVGMGAIGTILFARLARLAAESSHNFSIDALVKPTHLETLLKQKKVTTYAKNDKTEIKDMPVWTSVEFKVQGSALMANDSDRVRIRSLETDKLTNTKREPLNVVIVAVKAYDSAAVVQSLQREHAHAFDEDALVVLLQNGIGQLPAGLENQSSALNWQFAHGVTFVGGRVLSTGNVLVSDVESAMTYVAPLGRASANNAQQRKMERLQEVLRAAGLQCQALPSNEMQAILWKKLIVNASINPVAAILNAPNEVVGACEWSRRSVRAVVREAFVVAQLDEVPLNCTEEELVAEVLQVAINHGGNFCSMVADLRNGSRTEVEAINGQIVARGEAHGVPTPTNSLLVGLVRMLEARQTHKQQQPAA